MVNRLRSRLTFANVVALVALFFALGGISYAAIHLPRASVGKKQIKKRAVSASKLAGDSVYSRSLSPGLREQFDAVPSAASIPGAYRVRYEAAASTTPQLETALDMPGLRFRAQCVQSGGGTGLETAVLSSEDAVAQQALAIDTGTDPNLPGTFFRANIQSSFPGGVELPPSGLPPRQPRTTAAS